MELQNTNQFKKIAIVADHRAEASKKFVIKALTELGVDYVLPKYDDSPDNDYPDLVVEAYKLYATKKVDGLILMCGTGVGMMIAANKCKGIRCVLANDEAVAAFGRIHEDCNALGLAAGYSDDAYGYEVKACKRKMQRIVKTFITTPFGGGRHARRVEKLNNIK
ncbi:MAG: RpiB/LacA/LacB family sugar-phosphate isomerase [Clostridia bacterium]|nr:RpiB/LacA/LacB family sugar-phosphate isomerase [Clostridia bacterium]